MKISTIPSIIEASVYHLLKKIDLLPDEAVQRYLNRGKICDACPLNSNGWCSSKKALRLSTGNLFEKLPKYLDKIPIEIKHKPDFELYYKNAIWKTGCGCYLKLKQMSSEHCGLYKW
ncbi:hypothetical protein ACMGDK_11490 [Chryseobacterium sp. DT-3]|uniref:hypothetical protein n=1 Tax=Chryseobacterium sp. DT-3 TaxID=3396164 RepID=UPI003F194F46